MLKLFTRENFSNKTKLMIVKHAAKCQMCHISTECGECAHIVATGHNGPRNKKTLVREGIIPSDYNINEYTNGLYLCANCHTLIDKYPEKYTYEYLTNLLNQSDQLNQPHQPDQTVNVKKFKCRYCEKRYTHKTHMYRHMKIHRISNPSDTTITQ